MEADTCQKKWPYKATTARNGEIGRQHVGRECVHSFFGPHSVIPQSCCVSWCITIREWLESGYGDTFWMDYMLKCLSHSLCLNPEASDSRLSLYSLLWPELHLCAVGHDLWGPSLCNICIGNFITTHWYRHFLNTFLASTCSVSPMKVTHYAS